MKTFELPPGTRILKKYHQYVGKSKLHKLQTIVGRLNSHSTETELKVVAHRATKAHYQVLAIGFKEVFRCGGCGELEETDMFNVLN